MASDWRSIDSDSRPYNFHITILGKLFIHGYMCLSKHCSSVIWYGLNGEGNGGSGGKQWQPTAGFVTKGPFRQPVDCQGIGISSGNAVPIGIYVKFDLSAPSDLLVFVFLSNRSGSSHDL